MALLVGPGFVACVVDGYFADAENFETVLLDDDGSALVEADAQ